MSNRQSKPTISPVDFIHLVIKLDKKGEPLSVAPYQRADASNGIASGELLFRVVVLSEAPARAQCGGRTNKPRVSTCQRKGITQD